jgi:hypothetical protein
MISAEASSPIVLLGVEDSPVRQSIASHLHEIDIPCHVLSLDAPLQRKSVTLSSEALVWEGVDLLRAGAIWLEWPVFPWPQPLLPPDAYRDKQRYVQWSNFQREARALLVSAMAVAAEARPVVNRPAAAHLAVSPSLALDRLAQEGIVVHPWRLDKADCRSSDEPVIRLDASGQDRWHSPRIPADDEPALILEPFSDDVLSVIVIGGRPAGALRYPDCERWSRQIQTGSVQTAVTPDRAAGSNGLPTQVAGVDGEPEAENLAVRAAVALSLDFAAISFRMSASQPAVLLCEAGPDLAAWDRALNGRVAAALAEHLISLAYHAKGAMA